MNAAVTATATCLIATTAVCQSIAPESIFDQAVAFWDMTSDRDSNGASSTLTPAGGSVEFGVALEAEAREASLASGGDGLVARLDDAAFVIGQGANGEANVTGRAVTLLVRMRNQGSWDHTPFSKHGGGSRLQYNIFAFEQEEGSAEIGFELGTTRGVSRASGEISTVKARDWHTIVSTYDGRTIDLYIDGRLQSSVPYGGMLRRGSQVPLVLAGEPQRSSDGFNINRRLTGELDHAAIWSRALTEDEIIAVSGGVAPLQTPHLRPHAHFTPTENWINDQVRRM